MKASEICQSGKRLSRSEGLLRWVQFCNTQNLNRFLPFFCEEISLGWIPRDCLAWFAGEPQVFRIGNDTVLLQPDLKTPESRTAVLSEVLLEWKELGRIPGWRDELYRVCNYFDAEPFFCIERAAATLFGICSYGVHLNGIQGSPEQELLWLARRSRDRPQYPGCLDHLVAGGLTAEMNPEEVLIRECMEEAGISKELARLARPCGYVTVFMELGGRIKRDLLFCYDLELPPSFVPCNQDGEVESFHLKTFGEVEVLIAETDEIKLNCNLVMIDFLVRHGRIRPEDPFYTGIVAGLRGGGVA